MSPDPRSPELLREVAAGAEALDRGLSGPKPEVALLRAHGWLQAALPIAFGGQDWAQSAAGANDGFTALFSLASVSLPATRIYEGHVNSVRLIERNGTPAQRERIFADVRSGALLGIWGAQGDRPAIIRDHALYGTKTFASGLGEVACAIVTASDAQGGFRMVLAKADDPDRARGDAWDVAAMVGTCSGEFITDDLPAGDDWLLGPTGALFMEPDFNGGVWRLCAAYAGAMSAIARGTLDQMRQRASADDAAMRVRLGHVAHHAHTALLWAWQACRAAELPGGTTNDAIATSLFAREAIEQVAVAQLALAERMVGTSLHRRGSALGRQMRDLRFFLRQAALDGKLDAATSIWQDDPLFLLDAVVSHPR
ncbi:hypothetical protein [Novosphingobium sp.]|uniref:hypothetical protein n=1 Tax=Novosphingobium sp. TaxID=1874826 RepID=UPI003D0DB81F